MFERLRRNLAESSYGVLGLEMLVVILGILIAFQIDRWAEDRRDREQEYNYLVRLNEDLQFEIDSMSPGSLAGAICYLIIGLNRISIRINPSFLTIDNILVDDFLIDL